MSVPALSGPAPAAAFGALGAGDLAAASALVVLNLTAAARLPARRLASIFGFEVPSGLSALQNQAAAYLGDAGAQIAAAAAGVAGLPGIVKVFQDAQGLLAKGSEYLQRAWSSFLSLADQLKHIFSTFKPLQPVFASKTGLITLMTSRSNTQTLVSVVQQLLGTSGTLEALSSTCRTVVDVFSKLSGTLTSATQKLTGSGTRRLMADRDRQLGTFSYSQLLNGIDFNGLVTQLNQGVDQAASFASQLSKVNATLAPVLTTLQGVGHRVATGRRLFDVAGEQQKYQQAIEQIVPTWKGVEDLGIQMCPQVLSAQETAKSLVCRVKGFVGNNGALNAMTNMLGECPAAGASSSPEASQCPQKSMSAGVTDLLSSESGKLSWVLCGVAALGALGICGGGAKIAQNALNGDDSDEGHAELVETSDNPSVE